MHYPEVIGGLFLTTTFILHSWILALLMPQERALQALQISALLWLSLSSLGLGSLLYTQSRFRILTRVFVRHGLPLQSLLAHWTMVYGCLSLLSNLSLAILAMRDWELCFPSFAATWRLGIALVQCFAFALYIHRTNTQYRPFCGDTAMYRTNV